MKLYIMRGLVKRLSCPLAKISGVALDNFRLGAVERLGVHYESPKKINERIIRCPYRPGNEWFLEYDAEQEETGKAVIIGLLPKKAEE